MKKVILRLNILLFIILSLLVFYTYQKKVVSLNNNKSEIKETPKKETQKKEEEEKPKYTDNNPLVVGLYKNYRNNKERELIKEYTSKWQYHENISSFEVFYTKEDFISNKDQIELINDYKNKYENADDYKIGYQLEFSVGDNKINKTILSPKDSEDFFEYLEIYLYDDYHRDGSWYSYTKENEMNDETLLTSIKLTAGKKINEITSDIKLTAFTYDKDDFDEEGFYKGVSKYSITVKNDIAE